MPTSQGRIAATTPFMALIVATCFCSLNRSLQCVLATYGTWISTSSILDPLDSWRDVGTHGASSESHPGVHTTNGVPLSLTPGDSRKGDCAHSPARSACQSQSRDDGKVPHHNRGKDGICAPDPPMLLHRRSGHCEADHDHLGDEQPTDGTQGQQVCDHRVVLVPTQPKGNERGSQVHGLQQDKDRERALHTGLPQSPWKQCIAFGFR